jgi:AraC-like DNA-binding protein/mannose-6-phosphate isomerase-like protein (cupin superfamily)
MDIHPGANLLPIDPDPDTAYSPIAGVAWDEDRPRRIDAHRHHRGQLISVIRGVATVGTRQGLWIAPPNRAIWVPAGVEHWVRYSRTVALRSLFPTSAVSTSLPAECVGFHLDALSRELLNVSVDVPWDVDPNPSEMRLVRLLLDRISIVRQPALVVPDGKDRRTLRVMQRLRETPDDNRTLESWARDAGASERTLARLFLRDTGMSFTVWRRQYRLMLALEQLAMGQPVTTVAHNLGYETAGNFSTMFRGVFHQSPREFFRSQPSSV